MDEFKYLATKTDKYSFEDLCLLAKLLRAEGGCPWDREQTHKSIRKDIIEETYEVIEAIDKEDPSLMREELGDVLMQVIFHAEVILTPVRVLRASGFTRLGLCTCCTFFSKSIYCSIVNASVFNIVPSLRGTQRRGNPRNDSEASCHFGDRVLRYFVAF